MKGVPSISPRRTGPATSQTAQCHPLPVCAPWRCLCGVERASGVREPWQQLVAGGGDVPDGVRYLCLARTVHARPRASASRRASMRWGLAANSPMRSRLSMRVVRSQVRSRREAGDLVLPHLPAPDCELRAFPPLDREIRTDPMCGTWCLSPSRKEAVAGRKTAIRRIGNATETPSHPREPRACRCGRPQRQDAAGPVAGRYTMSKAFRAFLCRVGTGAGRDGGRGGSGFTTGNVNMRTGPDTAYPRVNRSAGWRARRNRRLSRQPVPGAM